MKKSIALVVISVAMLLMLVGCNDSYSGTNSNYQSNYVPNYNQPVNTQPQTEAQTSAVTLVNSEYQEIFTSRYIVDIDEVFFGLDSASFASVDADGMIEKLQFGYEDDIIMEMVDTVYYPVDGMTDSEKQATEQAIKEYFAVLESQSFCTASYDMGSSWYYVSFHLTHLDNLQNLQVLSQYGMLTGTDYNSRVSMSQTESDLLANGYVKK